MNIGTDAENRLKQRDFGIADGKLGGVDGNGQPADTGIQIVADEGTLPLRGKAAVGIQGEGEGGDDSAFTELLQCMFSHQ